MLAKRHGKKQLCHCRAIGRASGLWPVGDAGVTSMCVMTCAGWQEPFASRLCKRKHISADAGADDARMRRILLYDCGARLGNNLRDVAGRLPCYLRGGCCVICQIVFRRWGAHFSVTRALAQTNCGYPPRAIVGRELAGSRCFGRLCQPSARAACYAAGIGHAHRA